MHPAEGACPPGGPSALRDPHPAQRWPIGRLANKRWALPGQRPGRAGKTSGPYARSLAQRHPRVLTCADPVPVAQVEQALPDLHIIRIGGDCLPVSQT